MNKVLLVIVLLALIAIAFFKFNKSSNPNFLQIPNTTEIEKKIQELGDEKDISIVAKDLDTPWSIAFLPNGNILVTERPGKLNEIDIKTGNKKFNVNVNGVKEIGEGGLLGLEIDPDYKNNKYVYLYYTYGESGGETLNRVSRFNYSEGQLNSEKTMVDRIPGASNHNGGRIKFGPDKNLYITTGDAGDPSESQDINSLAGKVLRVNSEGQGISGNPFGNLAFSYGHRNPQGITWDKNGTLWETEHGRSGVLSGLDELNKIELGKNYGWKIIEGDETKDGMVTPIMNSGSNDTWAPGGIAYVGDKLFWGGLRGKTLYSTSLEGNEQFVLKKYFFNQFGRIRDVVTGPDNMIYISTSNNDGRGDPQEGDDKIIRINPDKL